MRTVPDDYQLYIAIAKIHFNNLLDVRTDYAYNLKGEIRMG